MKKTIIAILLVIFSFTAFGTSGAIANSNDQLYKIGTTWDNAWQRGVPGGPKHPTFTGVFTDSLMYQSAIDCADLPVISNYQQQCGESYVFSAAYRFENIQIDPHATVDDSCLRLFLSNSFPASATDEFISHMAIQDSGDTNDFKYQPDLVNRPRYGDILWDSKGIDNSGAYVMSPDFAALVQHVVDRPDWQRGNSITIIVYGVIYHTADINTWAHAYGYDAEGYDAHAGHPALFDASVAA